MTQRVCAICHFAFELDDVMQGLHNGSCLCLACYERTTHTEKPMPQRLRQELTEILKHIESP